MTAGNAANSAETISIDRILIEAVDNVAAARLAKVAKAARDTEEPGGGNC